MHSLNPAGKVMRVLHFSQQWARNGIHLFVPSCFRCPISYSGPPTVNAQAGMRRTLPKNVIVFQKSTPMFIRRAHQKAFLIPWLRQRPEHPWDVSTWTLDKDNMRPKMFLLLTLTLLAFTQRCHGNAYILYDWMQNIAAKKKPPQNDWMCVFLRCSWGRQHIGWW